MVAPIAILRRLAGKDSLKLRAFKASKDSVMVERNHVFISADLERALLDTLRSLIMDFLKDLWGFLKQRKKFWLLPLIVILLAFGVLIVLASSSAIAPFIYTLF